ncbi:MAG: disulfide bond formation protein DsbA [Alphaproteobacteria bacterium]|nr:disulfide bond formation protein DsbA [Alphaproteobacteria bacterium]
MPTLIPLWLDCRSPYSYLAVKVIDALERDFDVRIEPRPYSLDIKGVAGAAMLDPAAAARGLRRIKYLYMDVRRFATPLGLTILGPKKVFDGVLAHIAFLYATDCGKARAFLDAIYSRFFERRIDIESSAEIEALLGEIGLDPAGYVALRDGEGRARLAALDAAAESAGVFAVPTFVLDGELFWGQDRVDLLRATLAKKGLKT